MFLFIYLWNLFYYGNMFHNTFNVVDRDNPSLIQSTLFFFFSFLYEWIGETKRLFHPSIHTHPPLFSFLSFFGDGWQGCLNGSILLDISVMQIIFDLQPPTGKKTRLDNELLVDFRFLDIRGGPWHEGVLEVMVESTCHRLPRFCLCRLVRVSIFLSNHFTIQRRGG